jgi:hypothetical protein
MTIYRGRLTQNQPRARTLRDDGSRLWKVSRDPSGAFLNGMFRWIDLQIGGFDEGTVFTHVRNGQRRKTDATGRALILYKRRGTSSRRRRNRRTAVAHNKHAIRNGGASAIL